MFSDQSVRDNLLLGAYAKKDDPASLEAKIERSYVLFPRLRERQEQMAGTLSGGEQQMLAIARSPDERAKLLLLDEPSLGLAPLIIQDIFRTIRSLREMGLTILLVEQMANQALAVADRVRPRDGPDHAPGQRLRTAERSTGASRLPRRPIRRVRSRWRSAPLLSTQRVVFRAR